MENNREFKGVWIPREIWLDTNLNMIEKGIFTEIDSLDNDEKGCFASNKYFADFCQCSETKVSTAISKLKQLGYVYEKSFDGRQRVLKSRLIKNENQPYKNLKAGLQNLQENNMSNNSLNNKKINDIYISEFNDLWAIYPRKMGKPNALKAYIKARKNGTTFDEVKQGIENYCAHISAKQTATEYIKHGSTWFNQEAWNDEYDLTPKQSSNKDTKPSVSIMDDYNAFNEELNGAIE